MRNGRAVPSCSPVLWVLRTGSTAQRSVHAATGLWLRSGAQVAGKTGTIGQGGISQWAVDIAGNRNTAACDAATQVLRLARLCVSHRADHSDQPLH